MCPLEWPAIYNQIRRYTPIITWQSDSNWLKDEIFNVIDKLDLNIYLFVLFTKIDGSNQNQNM